MAQETGNLCCFRRSAAASRRSVIDHVFLIGYCTLLLQIAFWDRASNQEAILAWSRRRLCFCISSTASLTMLADSWLHWDVGGKWSLQVLLARTLINGLVSSVARSPDVSTTLDRIVYCPRPQYLVSVSPPRVLFLSQLPGTQMLPPCLNDALGVWGVRYFRWALAGILGPDWILNEHPFWLSTVRRQQGHDHLLRRTLWMSLVNCCKFERRPRRSLNLSWSRRRRYVTMWRL